MRDAAGELDHLEAALDIALRVRHDLAVLGREHVGQLVHVLFDERLEVEHHAGALLRVLRGPFREGLERRLDGRAHFRL
jgi:hypothetical protein